MQSSELERPASIATESEMQSKPELQHEPQSELQDEKSQAVLYSICIKNQNYSFSCTDGEEHVRKLEAKINEVIDALAKYEEGHVLTDYAMKIVLLLADEVVRGDQYSDPQEMQKRFNPLLEELDRVLIST